MMCRLATAVQYDHYWRRLPRDSRRITARFVTKRKNVRSLSVALRCGRVRNDEESDRSVGELTTTHWQRCISSDGPARGTIKIKPPGNLLMEMLSL